MNLACAKRKRNCCSFLWYPRRRFPFSLPFCFGNADIVTAPNSLVSWRTRRPDPCDFPIPPRKFLCICLSGHTLADSHIFQRNFQTDASEIHVLAACPIIDQILDWQLSLYSPVKNLIRLPVNGFSGALPHLVDGLQGRMLWTSSRPSTILQMLRGKEIR